jgi:Glyoxalase-like domain
VAGERSIRVSDTDRLPRRVRQPTGLLPPEGSGCQLSSVAFSPRLVRKVIVFDAADLRAESTFWAELLGGRVFEDEAWHSVIDASGEWTIGVQLAPDHVPPDWPNGSPQQVHVDLHVEDPRATHDRALALGAKLLRSAGDLSADQGHQVYTDPAGHPFCIGWGHPSREALPAFIADHRRDAG